MADDAKFTGWEKARAKLKSLPDKVADAVMQGMEDQAKEMVAAMKNFVPKDTGTLRDSIGWTWGPLPKDAKAVFQSRPVRRASRKVFITIYAGSKEAYYARWVEFGTAPHINAGLFKGSANPGTRARPFFYQVWRAKKKKAKAAVSRNVRKTIKQVAAQ
jgi:HK97 gp10 family phage protein